MRDFTDLIDRLKAGRQPVIDLWAVFSRFEYALKRAGFATGDQQKVAANWDKLAADLADVWNPHRTDELRKAVEYITQIPPRKQVLDNGTLKWVENVRPAAEPPLQSLIIHIRAIRNNLFHGGKYPSAPPVAPERDTRLIQAALVILDECLSLCEQKAAGVFQYFTEPLQ
jgi:hypothetical protein